MILVGGLEHGFHFSICWEESSQLTNSYFSEGWLNHQPVINQVPLQNSGKIMGKPSLNVAQVRQTERLLTTGAIMFGTPHHGRNIGCTHTYSYIHNYIYIIYIVYSI